MMMDKFCLQAQIDSPFPCKAGEGQEGGVKIREATKFQNLVAARHAYTPTPVSLEKGRSLFHKEIPPLPRCAGEGVIAWR